MKYVLTNCNIIDGYADSKIQESMSIFIDDEKIVKIEKSSNNTCGYKIVNLGGKYVAPGLINMHVHLFGSGMPSKVLAGGGGQAKLMKFIKTRLGKFVLDTLVKSSVKKELYSGVTTLRSVGDFQYSDVRIRDKVRAGKIEGPRMFVSGPAITVPGGHGDGTFSMSSDSIEGLVNLVKKNYDNKVDFIKICVTGGVMDAKKEGEPGEVKMNLEETKAVCEEAHRLGLKVASHTESLAGVKITIESKVDTIEHGSDLDEKMIKDMKAYGGAMITTMSPAWPLAKLPSEVTKLNDMCIYNSNIVFNQILQGAKAAINNGVLVGLGTDASCPFVTQYNTWREVAYFASFVEVSNQKALSVASLENAKILGIDKETGTIEQGKYADLIVMSENPLENIRTLGQLNMVIHNGKIIKNPKVKKSVYMEQKLDEIANY